MRTRMKKQSSKQAARFGKAETTLPPEAYDRLPRVQLTFTDETPWLTRFDPRGQPTATYPVSLTAVANAFKGVPARTGLLPPEVLFWESQGRGERLAVWLPPARHSLRFQLKRVETLVVPLPGFVLVGQNSAYSIYAALERPNSPQTVLYRAPLPNVHDNGLICNGTVQFPVCTAQTIHRAAVLFFESDFNHDLAVPRLIALLRRLHRDKAKMFPAEHLERWGNLERLMGRDMGADWFDDVFDEGNDEDDDEDDDEEM